jgi:hypothetical protein
MSLLLAVMSVVSPLGAVLKNTGKKKKKKNPNKYIVSKEKRISCFSQCRPQFSLCPNNIPLGPSEKETLLFFCASSE